MVDVEKQREEQRGGITGKGFVPGQSGNPAGRPKKGDAWADLIKEVMEGIAGDLTGEIEDKRTVRKAITEAMATKAAKGDERAAAWLADRESGRPGQRLALEDPHGNPLGPVFLPVKEKDAKETHPQHPREI